MFLYRIKIYVITGMELLLEFLKGRNISNAEKICVEMESKEVYLLVYVFVDYYKNIEPNFL